MSVAKYQVFLKTVECGSFTAAAREMNFTQSGVSHAIGSLEEELGVPLLIRSHGGVTPTADGLGAAALHSRRCAAMQHQHGAAGRRPAGSGDRSWCKVATFTSVSEAVAAQHPEDLSGPTTPISSLSCCPPTSTREIGNWVPGRHGRTAASSASPPTVEKYLDCWISPAGPVEGHRPLRPPAGGCETPSRLRRWSSIP